MPRYTPIIFAAHCDGTARENAISAFSDGCRFNDTITLAIGDLPGNGDIRRFDRNVHPAFALFYAACAADRLYPYDPLVLVEARASAFEISRAILGIDMAIHAVMKGHPVVLDPTQVVGHAMSIGRVMFPAAISKRDGTKVVLVNSGTVIDLSSEDDRPGFLSLASMMMRNCAPDDIIRIPENVPGAEGQGFSDVVAEWTLRDNYAVGQLSVARRLSTS